MPSETGAAKDREWVCRATQNPAGALSEDTGGLTHSRPPLSLTVAHDHSNPYAASPREKISLLACFAAAGALVCGVVALAPAGVLTTVLLHAAFASVRGFATMSLVSRYALTRDHLSPVASDDSAKKLGQLNLKAKEYADAMGLKHVPEIRIWRWGPSMIGPASCYFFTRRFVVLDEDSLRRGTPTQLESVLAQEMAHIRMNHMYQRMGLLYMLNIATSFCPAYWLLALPIYMHSVRQSEFQSDRIGASVSGRPQELAQFLRTHQPYRETANLLKDWRDASLLAKAGRIAAVAFMAPFHASAFAMMQSNPSRERRVDRLENGNRLVYPSDMPKAVLTRWALHP
jgi:Zn-dependent protease with chaperone function